MKILSTPSFGCRSHALDRSENPATRGVAELEHLIDFLVRERKSIETKPVERGWGVLRPTAEDHGDQPLELSIVIPCRNDEKRIGDWILKSIYALEKLEVSGEVIVADHGSTDDSLPLASALGVRMVSISGNRSESSAEQLQTAARGQCVIIGDRADGIDVEWIVQAYRQLV